MFGLKLLRTPVVSFSSCALNSTLRNRLPALPNPHLNSEITAMLNKHIVVPNSVALMNLREVLLKTDGDVNGIMEDIDALLRTSTVSGLISMDLRICVGCMNAMALRRVWA